MAKTQNIVEAVAAPALLNESGKVAVSPRRLSLRVNFWWTLAGHVVYNACQWGIVIALAKLGSPELVGHYTLALAITAPIFMFSNLSLATVQATDARDEYAFGEYYGLRILSSCLALLPVGLILLFGGYSREISLIVLLMALAKFVESNSDVIFGSLQKHERMDLIARSLVLKGGLSLTLILVALAVSGSLPVAITGLLLAWFYVMRFYDRRNAARFGPTRPVFSRRALLTLAWTALPLGLVASLNSLNVQLPRFFLERSHGERELGLFGAVASLAVFGQMISRALSRSVAPRLSQYYAAGKKAAFLKLLYQLVGIGVLVGTVGLTVAWLFGRRFLALVYTPEYAGKYDVLMWIMVSMGVITTGTFLGTALTAARSFQIQMWIHACKVAITGAMCLLLIPRFGAVAGAWTMVAANLFSVLVYLCVVLRLVRGLVVSPVNAATSQPRV